MGLQLSLWLGLGAATTMVWVGGATAVPYASTLVGVLGLSCLTALAYAARLGVLVDQPRRMSRARLVPYVALLALFVAGLLRTSSDGSGRSFATGLATGAAAALAVLGLSAWRARRGAG